MTCPLVASLAMSRKVFGMSRATELGLRVDQEILFLDAERVCIRHGHLGSPPMCFRQYARTQR